jgi:DNA polymerase-3 subunit beta
MKFTCSQSALFKAVNTVSKAVSVKTTIPALKGILLEVKDSKLYLTGSDLDFSVMTNIEAGDCEEGSVVVSAKLFGDAVRKLPNAMVRASLEEGDKLKVSCLDLDFVIVGTPGEEYPSTGVIEASGFELDNKVIRNLINKTSFAASIDEKKGVLVGCCLKDVDGKLEMAALDGFRMAIAKEEAKLNGSCSVIIPARIMNEVSKILADEDPEEKVSVEIDGKKIKFKTPNADMISRLLDGDYIRYRDILPATYKTRIVAAREDILSSVERASLFVVEGKNNLIRLNVSSSGIEITSRNDTGNIRESISAEVEGDKVEIGFNSKYLMDCLKAINDDEVVLEMNGNLSACMIKPVEGDSYTYLVLPVRLAV